MATKIDAERTYWLPFTKVAQRKRQPTKSNGYKTADLWENILGEDSLMDILYSFVHLQVEEYEFEGQHEKRKKSFFSFSSLDSVRKITSMQKLTEQVKTN
jgi:type I restriction enzyme R subunit